MQGVGVRQIAGRIGRAPSTVSRELRRNAALRSEPGTAGSDPRRCVSFVDTTVARGSVAQPTMRLANASRTLASHSTPSAVTSRVRSATHSRFGASTRKSRSTRSGAAAWFGFCRVEPWRQPRRRCAPCRPWVRVVPARARTPVGRCPRLTSGDAASRASATARTPPARPATGTRCETARRSLPAPADDHATDVPDDSTGRQRRLHQLP